MTTDRAANRLPGASESNVAPVAEVRISNVPSRPNLTHPAKGCISGRSDRIARALVAMHPLAAQRRFWSKVTKLNGPNACWVWHSSLSRQGYGNSCDGASEGRMIAAFLMLCQVIGPGSVFILLLMALLNAAHVLRDMWREHQLKQREIRELLASISTTKAGR